MKKQYRNMDGKVIGHITNFPCGLTRSAFLPDVTEGV